MTPDLTASAADLNATTAAEPNTAAPAAAAPSARYQFGDEIARGGMGVVFRATDLALGREVAVKVLHDRFDPLSAAAARFADEARIAGQLQHPGIPPVHDLGTLPDGRPFLAMKLIKGDTLEKQLKDRPDPSADRGKFLGVFEQICHAVGYAHSHRVIHRDLKPANVMVGSHGEVQVMDWGLAKVLGRAGPEPADPHTTLGSTQIRSGRDSDGSFTQAGSVLGTPAFMSPEQALGTVAKTDARSDVFGLGGILAVILTGQPPFATGSVETVRLQAAQGNLADCYARLAASGAEPDLIDLCRRCLAADPKDRPTDGGEVARAVAGLRQAADERARQAETDRARAETQVVEGRKRRRVQLALTAAVGLMLLAGAAVAWWRIDDERATRARQDRTSLAMANHLTRCEDALKADDAGTAAVALAAAEELAGDGASETLADRLARCRADVTVLQRLDAAEALEWMRVDGLYQAKRMGDELRAALLDYGVEPGVTPDGEAAARIKSSPVADRLVSALD